jgi:hypothetical protein
MIKDVFILKKNSWHARLMKFTWNLDFYDFSHMCPYFWLTIFNMIIFPVTFFFKVIAVSVFKAFGDGMEALGDYLEAVADKRTEFLMERMIADEQYRQSVIDRAIKRGEGRLKWNKRFSHIWDKFMYYSGEEVKEKMLSEASIYKEAFWEKERKRLEKERERNRRNAIREAEQVRLELEEQQKRIARERRFADVKRERMLAAKRRIAAINRIVKPIGQMFIYIIAAAVVLGIGYLIYLACIAAGHVEHETYRSIGKWTSYILIGAAVLGILIISIVILVKKYSDSITDFFTRNETLERISDGVVWFFMKCAVPFIWLAIVFAKAFKGVSSLFGLIIQMFKNQCPAIDWKD